jgi:hypothetical protein
MRRPRMRLRSLMIAVAVVVVVLGAIALSTPRRRPFDPVAWRAGDRQPEREREEMADDLVASRALLGKTRSEVVRLLGEPPPTEYFRSFDLVYRLGMERGFMSIDSEWLVLKLGPDGRVVECRIVTD